MGSEPWLIVDAVPLEEGTVAVVEGEESRHVAGPLRLRPGDRVTLADGCGRTADAILRSVSGRRSEAEILAVRVLPAADRGVAVALAVLHGRAMDWAVQKAVEIGVATFVPVVADRSQVRLKTAQGRTDHWRRVARQAIKQCRRPWQMEVGDPLSLAELVSRSGERRGSVADSAGDPLSELPGRHPDLLLIGPEGGFGPSDRQLLKTTGWPMIRLGRFVLRAETAAVVGAALLISARERRHDG